MGFGEAITSGFSNYVNFRDRACRSEFWFWLLFCALGGIATAIIDYVSGIQLESGKQLEIANTLFGLVTLIPGIAMAIRRLHDLDRTGWWWLLYFVPMSLAGIFAAYYIFGATTNYWIAAACLFGVIQIICWIVLLIWFCTRGTNGPNRFGPDPLAVTGLPNAPRMS
jgi:uncharacterized membrane protein YhaH (DUF805 family)